MVVHRLFDSDGDVVGAVLVGKPMAGMSILVGMAMQCDPALLERLDEVDAAARGRDPDRVGYPNSPISRPPPRRLVADAPAIAVCEL